MGWLSVLVMSTTSGLDKSSVQNPVYLLLYTFLFPPFTDCKLHHSHNLKN